MRSLFLVSLISTAATMVMTSTTAGHIAWSDAAFQLLAVVILGAIAVAHARRISLPHLMFMLGVIAASLPALMIAVHHRLDHWDDFMTWLPNALYIWKMGGFPTAAVPVVASDLPGYPPGSSLVLAALWSLAGRVVDDAGPVLNVACLMILPGVVLRALGIGQQQSPLKLLGLGAVLGLAATTLNVGVDWHWVLASLPEVATLVAFAAAFVLSVECLFRKAPDARSSLVVLAGVLALVTNLKQTGLVLVGVLLVASSVVALICPPDDRRSLRDAAVTAVLVLIPSMAVWLCWHFYLSVIFSAYSVSFRPIGQWYYSMLPELFGAIGLCMADHWLFFLPVGIVVARGWFVLGRCLFARDRIPVSASDRLAATFCLVETGYVGFLMACYVGAFNDEEISRAAEFFRYQAQIGGAGLLVAVVMAAERLRQPRFIALMPGILVLQLAAVWVLSPAAGIYQTGGVLTASEVDSIRRLGREAGKLIATANEASDVAFVTYDHMLAVTVMRYEMWASAPTKILHVTVSPEKDAKAALADLFSDARRTSTAVALIDANPRCGFYVMPAHAGPLPTSKSSANCIALILRLDNHGLDEEPAMKGEPPEY